MFDKLGDINKNNENNKTKAMNEMMTTMELPKKNDEIALPAGVARAGFSPVELPVLVGDERGRAVRVFALLSEEEVRVVAWHRGRLCETLFTLARSPEWESDPDEDFWVAAFWTPETTEDDWMEDLDLDFASDEPVRLLGEALEKVAGERGWIVTVLA